MRLMRIAVLCVVCFTGGLGAALLFTNGPTAQGQGQLSHIGRYQLFQGRYTPNVVPPAEDLYSVFRIDTSTGKTEVFYLGVKEGGYKDERWRVVGER